MIWVLSGPNRLGCESFGRPKALGGQEEKPVLTLMVNMPPANYSWGHLAPTCNSTEVVGFQSRRWPGKLLTSLNLCPTGTQMTRPRAEMNNVISTHSSLPSPSPSPPPAPPRCLPPHFSPSPVVGLYTSTHWRSEAGGLILKFNLLSFSHREKEWERRSKNRLACQNC